MRPGVAGVGEANSAAAAATVPDPRVVNVVLVPGHGSRLTALPEFAEVRLYGSREFTPSVLEVLTKFTVDDVPLAPTAPLDEGSQTFTWPILSTNGQHRLRLELKDWGAVVKDACAGLSCARANDCCFESVFTIEVALFHLDSVTACSAPGNDVLLDFSETYAAIPPEEFQSAVRLERADGTPYDCAARPEALVDGNVFGDPMRLRCTEPVTPPFHVAFGRTFRARQGNKTIGTQDRPVERFTVAAPASSSTGACSTFSPMPE